MKELTQEEEVLNYMNRNGSISSMQAFQDLSITRLAAVIWVLRHDRNMDIESVTKKSKNGKTYTEYRIKKTSSDTTTTRL